MEEALREAEQEITYVIEDQENYLNWLESEKKKSDRPEIYDKVIEKFKGIMI